MQGVPDDMLTAPASALFFDRSFLWRFRAAVLDVHDGDTCTILADTGFDGRHLVHLRIADLYAPELNAPGGREAQRRLEMALPQRPNDWPLRVISKQRETVVSEVRSFERWVAQLLVVQDDGSLVDVKDVLNG